VRLAEGHAAVDQLRGARDDEQRLAVLLELGALVGVLGVLDGEVVQAELELLDDTGAAVRTWRFRRGLPVRWSGPALVASSSAVALEELEIAHEGLFVQTGGAVGELLNTVTSIFGGT
jgi:hypothetical protein